MNMPTQSHIEETPKDDGTVSKKLIVEFSNGSLEQLRNLATFFAVKDNDPYQTIIFAISVLETVKENRQKSKESLDK